VETNHFNCKKLLKTHYSIIPLFQHSNCDPPARSPYRLAFLGRRGDANSLDLYGSFSAAASRSGAVSLAGRQTTASGITGSGHPVFIRSGQGGVSGNKFFQVMAAAIFASGHLTRTCNEKFAGLSAVHTQKIKKRHIRSP
jgi:hypothetical protein